MGWLDLLAKAELRTRLLNVVMALGCFVTLPVPHPQYSTPFNVVLFSLWCLVGAWAWSLWFQSELAKVFWVAALLIAMIGFLRFQLFIQAPLLLLWLFWTHARQNRILKERNSKGLKLVALGIFLMSGAGSRAQEPLSEEELRQMEASMGDLSDLVTTPPPKKKKKRADEAIKKPTKATNNDAGKPLPKKKVSEASSARIDAMADVEETETAKVLPPTRADERVKKTPLKKSNSKVVYDEDKYQQMEDLSGLPQAEKELIKKNLPKPALEKRKAENANLVDDTVSVVPKYLSGLQVTDFSSCSTYDQIPWRFSQDRRKNRLLMKDKLRHQLESTFKVWEIHQVMDAEGYVTYIFRNAQADGRYDTIAIKDTIYNRFVETPRGKKQTELQDLKTLINRPAITFYAKDGASLAIIPSSIGRTALVIEQGAKEGRSLPPIFIRGNTCDRPDDDVNADTQAKKNIGSERPPISPSGK